MKKIGVVNKKVLPQKPLIKNIIATDNEATTTLVNLKLKVDYAEYGGAPLLGVKAPVIISHGKSNPKAIKNAIFQAINSASSNLDSVIEQRLEKYLINESSSKEPTL